MPALLITGETSQPIQTSKSSHPAGSQKYQQAHRAQSSLSFRCLYTPSEVLVVKISPASCLASSSVTSKMSHITFDLLARILGPIFRLLSASTKMSLLIPINFWVFTSMVSKEIILVFTVFIASGIVRSSFLFKYWGKCSCFWTQQPISLFALFLTQAVYKSKNKSLPK